MAHLAGGPTGSPGKCQRYATEKYDGVKTERRAARFVRAYIPLVVSDELIGVFGGVERTQLTGASVNVVVCTTPASRQAFDDASLRTFAPE